MKLEAALRLLEAEDLRGKVVSADAGLLKGPFVRTVVEKGGAYTGLIKDNQAWLKQVVENWIRFHRPQGIHTWPDWEKTEKKHGRLEVRKVWLEVRKVWLVVCDEDMQTYLHSEFGWPGMQACGWIVRYRKNLSSGKEEQTCSLWVAGAAFPWRPTAEQVVTLLRGHRGIENRIFYVRDVTMDEYRLHGRKIGYSLSNICNIAINLLRTLGALYLPDARRRFTARPDLGLPLLC